MYINQWTYQKCSNGTHNNAQTLTENCQVGVIDVEESALCIGAVYMQRKS